MKNKAATKMKKKSAMPSTAYQKKILHLLLTVTRKRMN